MKIDTVTITIKTIDSENAVVNLSTIPQIESGKDEEIEDTPAVLLGSAIWEIVQDFLESSGNNNSSEGNTLQ